MKVLQIVGVIDVVLQVVLDVWLIVLVQVEGLLDLLLDEMLVVKFVLDMMVIFYFGDGGWCDLDYEVGQQLQVVGVLVVGVDFLCYFWSECIFEEIVVDLLCIICYYCVVWGVRYVVLLGYFFGVDILLVSYDLLFD